MNHDKKHIKEILHLAKNLYFIVGEENYKDSVQDIEESIEQYVEHIIEKNKKKLIDKLNNLQAPNEITQGILSVLEFRGFYDCGKYLDADTWDLILPHIINLIDEDYYD